MGGGGWGFKRERITTLQLSLIVKKKRDCSHSTIDTSRLSEDLLGRGGWVGGWVVVLLRILGGCAPVLQNLTLF